MGTLELPCVGHMAFCSLLIFICYVQTCVSRVIFGVCIIAIAAEHCASSGAG